MNVVPEGGYACSGDAVSQEVELSDNKDALLQIEGQPVGGEDGERCPEVLRVLLFGLAVYRYFIII
jgi:hypothetical protein